ncbi:MAG TPA: B12-binding domain-containing radical SAM protein [Methanomicrobia archaeon]|nr:B12-binding domain-containing radical SAM protein [Methanomicrobia archaeon]
MSDVLFVYPNIFNIPVHPEFDRYERLMLQFAEERELVGLARGTIVPPTALLLLSAYLKEHQVATSFLDLTVECCEGKDKHEALLAALQKEDPLVVAVNGMEDCFLSELYDIARVTKRYNETITVVTGGVSATTRDVEILTTSLVDFVVRGEGEQTLLSLVQALMRGNGVESVRGLSGIQEGRLLRTEDRPFMDVTTLPLPDRENYPLARLYALNGGVDLIYASRGCSGSCAFCNAPGYWKRVWRAREPGKVVEELARLEEMGATSVHIYDLNFGLDKRWVAEICAGVRKERLEIVWDCELALHDFTKPFLQTLYDGNCRGAFCGIEAVNQLVLDSVHKSYRSHDLMRYLRTAKAAGIHVDGGYIFGLPEDTDQGLQALTRLAGKLLEEDLVETPAPFLFVPFLGTEIGDDPARSGIEIVNQNTEEWHFFPPNPLASTRYLSAEKVHREWARCLTNVSNILESKLGT